MDRIGRAGENRLDTWVVRYVTGDEVMGERHQRDVQTSHMRAELCYPHVRVSQGIVVLFRCCS